MGLQELVSTFRGALLDAVQNQCAPLFDGSTSHARDEALDALKRKPFDAQRGVIHSMLCLLSDHDQPAGIINAEMGTGKTMMAIAVAKLMHDEGFERSLVICPPHLVYKWRREIMNTIPNARVWILNGPDTLAKLLKIREMSNKATVPEFFVLGRVRMRMGFHWRPAFVKRLVPFASEMGSKQVGRYAACPSCGSLIMAKNGEGDSVPLPFSRAEIELNESRFNCQDEDCGAPLWTLTRKGRPMRSYRDQVLESLQKMPTIGPKKAEALVARFGEELLGSMLSDNIYQLVNLMDADGELVFSDRQAKRIERALATTEVGFGQGDYQATEFIKRYLPQGYFGLLVVDEGHEYKNGSSAQGQAMGVLARKCQKTLLLTGTLMGGYADDLFYLLWRLNPAAMIADGFGVNSRNRLGTAQTAFMGEHGVLKDVFREADSGSHRTARGRKTTHRVVKGPGFGPKGIMRYVLPITAFLKLRDIDAGVLPPYDELFESVPMTEEQREAYRRLEQVLVAELKHALRQGDNSLLGVVLNCLLAWPDCTFRDELVRHPRTRAQIAYQPFIFDEATPSPKEAAMIQWVCREKGAGRRVLVYSIYSGKRDTTTRLKLVLENTGMKVAVLRASVSAEKREDWIADQVDRGVDAVVTNPELVKTGLDLLEFPTIIFMQTGYNVFTLWQAARRSWRIGQDEDVRVIFLGYEKSAQTACLELMAAKIAVAQSTSGDMPDSGLDVLNQSGDSIEIALAKQLVEA
nr:DEAD/DEAH box helicase [Nitrogeniibacter aestuarii]